MVRAISDSGSQTPGQDHDVWCSLITVTYNSRDALMEFWNNNRPLPQGIEWIVVDNSSSDGSADLAEALGATLVIRLDENLGFASSNNAGLAAARGSFIGFVNPDVRVDYSDLPGLRRIAEQDRAIVSPQLVNQDGTLQPNGRGFPLLLDKVRNRLGGEERLRDRYLLFSETEEPRKVCWLMGASIFSSREALDELGAWDPHFFLYYEDKDFCLRAWKAGFPVLLVPSSKWTHGWARETVTLSVTPWKRELSSMLKFYRRYPEFLLGKRLAARVHSRINLEVYGTA